MDKLYPIVRRPRRPLLPEDPPQPLKQSDAPATPELKQPDASVVAPPNKKADAPPSPIPAK